LCVFSHDLKRFIERYLLFCSLLNFLFFSLLCLLCVFFFWVIYSCYIKEKIKSTPLNLIHSTREWITKIGHMNIDYRSTYSGI
jgi:hypothetical protein